MSVAFSTATSVGLWALLPRQHHIVVGLAAFNHLARAAAPVVGLVSIRLRFDLPALPPHLDKNGLQQLVLLDDIGNVIFDAELTRRRTAGAKVRILRLPSLKPLGRSAGVGHRAGGWDEERDAAGAIVDLKAPSARR